MSERQIGAFEVGVFSTAQPRVRPVNEGEYAFHVEYEATPKSDIEEWDVILKASSRDAAYADMRRRYTVKDGSSASYTWREIQLGGGISRNPLLLVAEEAVPE